MSSFTYPHNFHDGVGETASGVQVMDNFNAVQAALEVASGFKVRRTNASGGDNRRPWRATKRFSPVHSETKPWGLSMMASS